MEINVKTDVPKLVEGLYAAGFSPYKSVPADKMQSVLQIWADMFFAQNVLVRRWDTDWIRVVPCTEVTKQDVVFADGCFTSK